MTQISKSIRPSVVHLGKFYPPHAGGMETHLLDLATRQARMFSVSVIVANGTRQTEHAVMDGIRVTRVGRFSTIASMPVCPGLTSVIRNHPADLVHLHMPNPGAAFSFLRSEHRGKLIITHHADTLGRKGLRLLADPVVRRVMARAYAIIVTSARYLHSSDELAAFQSKCRVIPLGIEPFDLTDFNGASPAEVKGEGGKPLILAIGRLVPYKGFDVLIRAMRHVDAVLILIGTGPQASYLRELVASYGLQQRVNMLGKVDDLRPYYRSASIFVLPSITRAEAFGIVQLEAMAAGLPVVNTNVQSGVPEVSLDGKTGLTVEPGDINGLGRAIQFLLEHRDLREQFGRAARSRVCSEFTADLMAERTASLYTEALSGSKTC